MFPSSPTHPGVDPYAHPQAAAEDADPDTRPRVFDRDPVPGEPVQGSADPATLSDAMAATRLEARIKHARGWAPVELLSIGIEGMKVRIPGGPPPTRTVLIAVRSLDGVGPAVQMLEEVAGKQREMSTCLLRLAHRRFLCAAGRQGMMDFLSEVLRFEIVPRAALHTGAEGVYFDYARAMRPATTPQGDRLTTSTVLRTRH